MPPSPRTASLIGVRLHPVNKSSQMKLDKFHIADGRSRVPPSQYHHRCNRGVGGVSAPCPMPVAKRQHVRKRFITLGIEHVKTQHAILTETAQFSGGDQLDGKVVLKVSIKGFSAMARRACSIAFPVTSLT